MSTHKDPPPRYSDPGERISLTDLEEIKPLGTTPPPVPNEAAEHFDLDEAMTRALSSVAAPPPPTITIESKPEPKKESRNLRPMQAGMAIAVGAAIAWFVQHPPTEQTVAEPSRVVRAEPSTIAQADPADDEAVDSFAELAAIEETTPVMSEPIAAIEANEPEAPTDSVVAQRPTREPREEEPTRPAATTTQRPAPEPAEPQEPAAANPNLPPDYDTPEARAAREAHRQEIREAEAAAQAAAAATAAAEAARGELPPHPDRDAVRDAMEGVRGAITECAAGAHGTATLRVTVHHSGRVQGALVEGSFAGTSEGSCMALAARRARFPAFSEDRFAVTYPFSF